MKFFQKCKDGGAESTVTAYVLIEIKWLFSIMLLRFDDGTRDAYHNHAFHAISWLWGGCLFEKELGATPRFHWPSIRPIFTWRSTFHKVTSLGRSWALTFRGPWTKTWREYIPASGEHVTLTNGRRVVS